LISKETIQQIQDRIDIIDIVGGFVKLKKRGANFLGNCPFHHEKTPSFTVSPSKEIYKCFGCGKSGNAIGFIMDHEKYSYVETLRWLANKYQITIEETETSPEYKALQQTSDSLFAINHFARNFFADSLLKTEEGRDIGLSYLKERGFTTATIEKFELGYDPEIGDAFANAAVAGQYNQELLLKTGLVVNRSSGLADNYRGRIIFPIHNTSGKVLGFGARIIRSNDRAPKYINTPENEIYVKSKILYGSYFARTSIDKLDECLLVEGYTDVVSLHQAGIENVVASGGTSLTPDQLRLIRKFTRNLTIIYDGDSAGIKAAQRGLDLALEEGLDVRLVLIPDNEDPDSYVNRIGAEAFRKFVQDNKKDFILFQLEIALKDAGNDSGKKATIVKQFAETIAKINKTEEFTKRQDYIKRVAETLKIEEIGLNDLVNKLIREKLMKNEDIRNNIPTTPITDQPEEIQLVLNKDTMQEQALVRALLEFGQMDWDENRKVAEFIFEQMSDMDLHELIDDTTLVEILMIYKTMYAEGHQPDVKSFLYHEDMRISGEVMKITADADDLSPNWREFYKGYIASREDLYRSEVASTLSYLQLRKIKRLMMENQIELEKSADPEQQLLLIQTHIELKKMEQAITKNTGTVIYK
jgi:DNA primase